MSEVRAFLEQAGWGAAQLTPLPGDASTRHYARLHMNGQSALLMNQPQGAETAAAPANADEDARRALGYNAVARLAGGDCRRFAAVAAYLRARGLSAPEIYAADFAQGLLLIEDLGDALFTTVLAGDPSRDRALYQAAVAVLARLHGEDAPAALAPGMALHGYDAMALLAETDLLLEWFLPLALGRPATEAEYETHRSLWRAALSGIAGDARVLVHRDYHAQNLLWLPEREGVGRVGLIDFQDAVAGPRAYDLVSLVEDARRAVPPALAEDAVAHYLAAMRAQGRPLDETHFRHQMAVMAAQRNVKIVGIFARLFQRDGKRHYLAHLPLVWRYLDHDLSHPALAALRLFYDRLVPAGRRQPAHLEKEQM